ncbi:helix-turn-helix domain-containing protein [Acuticoccus sp. I52.16.1]|uniref:helix-turn-helix domain-containing protein n=1 Tax=Acuticoccus sp. I52.16.1 TaxID=2928472 RepID=UPI001FD0BBBA|nr:helix-turn-helix transcriptional regulator [Acuticoccus sp. I52.16.1]UOM35255.1 helix-turn-helix domain-containing protein [Acuticoccus sp. I52.16.1]
MTAQRHAVVTSFRERLQLVIDRSRLSPSAYAKAVGIDRSTLAQLLAPANARLPRAETLAAVATLAGVSVDWLLGLTSQERPGAEVIEPVRIEGGAHSPIDDRFLRWYAEAETAGYRIRSVPRSFPDFLKSAEVTAYEYAQWPEVDEAATARWALERREHLRRSELSQESCVPIQALQAFAAGTGQWHALPARVRHEQLVEMSTICRELYPSLTFHLYDLRQTYSAPFTVFGPQRAMIYIGALFFMFTATEHVRALNRRFDDLIRAAVVQPHEACELMARLAEEVR